MRLTPNLGKRGCFSEVSSYEIGWVQRLGLANHRPMACKSATMDTYSKRTGLSGAIWLLILLMLLGCQGLAQIDNAAKSADPYKGSDYPSVSDKWSREARIYRGLDVELIAAATFKSAEFREAYADEYARVFLLTETEKNKLVHDQQAAAAVYHDFLMAAFIPNKKWNDFDKKDSVWKVYLALDGQRQLEALEIRRVKRVNAEISHFYPFITPWKFVYRIRFPQTYPGTDEPVINANTEMVSLVITGVQGTTTMQWELDQAVP